MHRAHDGHGELVDSSKQARVSTSKRQPSHENASVRYWKTVPQITIGSRLCHFLVLHPSQCLLHPYLIFERAGVLLLTISVEMRPHNTALPWERRSSHSSLQTGNGEIINRSYQLLVMNLTYYAANFLIRSPSAQHGISSDPHYEGADIGENLL